MMAYRLTVEMMSTALLYAQRVGDRKELAAHVRGGGSISPEMREYIAGLIEGEIPARANNRHASLSNAKRNRTISWFILRARAVNVGDDPSIDQACDKFGLGKRYVQKIFKSRSTKLLSLMNRL
jgi:hypothetical protein